MKYFNLLPKINYNDKEVRNILKKYQIVNTIDENYLQEYFITGVNTLDKISSELYDTPELWWLIALINDIDDIFYDLPLADEVITSIANDQASQYPEEQRSEKFFEFFEKLNNENNKKREIKVINPEFLEDTLRVINEEIKDEKEKLVELETKKKILLTLDEFRNYYDKASVDGIISSSEQLVLNNYINTLYYEYVALTSNYSFLEGQNQVYDDTVTAWNNLNVAWVNLKNNWSSETAMNTFESAVNNFSSILAELRIEATKYEDEALKDNFINGNYVLDLSLHKINGVPFEDYVFSSNGIVIWSGTEIERADMNETTNPELKLDDLFVAKDSNKEYRWNGSQWVELLNADYAQALADVDGKRSIYSSFPEKYQENDLLIPNQDITYISKTFKANEIYKATVSRDIFDENDWVYGVGAILGIDVEAYKNNLIDRVTDDKTAEALLQQYLEANEVRDLANEIEANAIEAINVALSQAEDGILSAQEKGYWRTKWIEIDANYNEVIANASEIGLSSDVSYTNAVAARNDFYNYLVSVEVWSVQDGPTDIISAEFQAVISDYYKKIQILLNKISDWEVTRRGLDQSGDFTGTLDGVNASTVKDNAANAIQTTIDMSSDSILTPQEKVGWRNQWDAIESNYNQLTAYAAQIGLSGVVEYDNYVNAKTALYNYLVNAGVWSNPNENYAIVGTAFVDVVSDYYDKMQLLVNAIDDRITYNIAEGNVDLSNAVVGTEKLTDLKTQTDNKISVYVQETTPSWTDANSNHVDDQWYKPSELKWYKYNGTSWADNDDSIFNVNNLAKGKSTIHYGTSAPADTLGVDGDYFVLEYNDLIKYYKKVSGSWVENGTYQDGADITGSNPQGLEWINENATNAATITTAGWYRIATNSGSRAQARFIIRNTESGRHNTAEFIAGTNYNKASDINLSLLAFSKYATQCITKARILTNSTYDDQYLDVYINSPAGSVNGFQYWLLDNIQDPGWVPVDWTSASIPAGYTSTELIIDKDHVANGTKGALDAGVGLNNSSSAFISSGNYSPGQLGWKITGEGDAEFNSADIRGNVSASSFTCGGSFLTANAASGASTIYLNSTYDFSSSGSGWILGSSNDKDYFSWTGKADDRLTGCTGVLQHPNGAVVIPKAPNIVLDKDSKELRVYGYDSASNSYSSTDQLVTLGIKDVGDGGSGTDTAIARFGHDTFSRGLAAYFENWNEDIPAVRIQNWYTNFANNTTALRVIHGWWNDTTSDWVLEGHGVEGFGDKGVVGYGDSYDFYAAGPGADGPFTGAHDALSETIDIEVGDIIIDIDVFMRRNISNTITTTNKSTKIKDKAVIGVINNTGLSWNISSDFDLNMQSFSGVMKELATLTLPATIYSGIFNNITSTNWEYYRNKLVNLMNYTRIIINSLGEGQINVVAEGGNLEAGDYICSSSTPGKGMKQDDDLLHNYTVAKSRENVIWTQEEIDNNTVKMVACTYHCG